MKVTCLVLIILGSLMIVFNLLAYLGKTPDVSHNTEISYKVAYYIGYNFFFILGAILLIIGYRLRTKAMNKKTKKDLLDNFLK